ncbi:MAG TPA: hypothetical protein VMJ70_13120 [Candidatus Sulfotelmatobacter sp.]|nr:hypothetical protein [Candidatus Sulfotelmatobacter sp.]
MTRIFDALKKARGGGAPTEVMPPAAPAHSSSIHAVMNRGAAAVSAARHSFDRADLIPIGPVAPMDETVAREMSTLRVILESSLTERLPRSVMLTSSQAGEGTTTVTLQFAQTLVAEAAHRVLILDANPRLRSPFYEAAIDAMRAGEGRGRAAMDLLSLSDCVRRFGPMNVAAIRDLLETVSAGYDWVLVDSPALLESPDTAPLAAQFDAVVVVVQAGRTKRPVLVRATDLLRRSGANVVGTVLNRRRLEIPDFIYRRI